MFTNSITIQVNSSAWKFKKKALKLWPNGLVSPMQQLQNQNLRTDLRRVAKRIRKSDHKFTEVAKSDNFPRIYSWLPINL